MRIVAGAHKGRTLATPKGDSTRPTSDRVREAIFNVLQHNPENPGLAGANVLDLFAGSGALGLEALSRGAATCLFVDTDANARAIIRQNIEAMHLEGVARLFRRDATNMGPAKTRGQVSFVFLDPPYGKGLGERALHSLVAGNWLDDNAFIVLEERAGLEISWPENVTLGETRTYGDTAIHFARVTAPSTTTSDRTHTSANLDNEKPDT